MRRENIQDIVAAVLHLPEVFDVLGNWTTDSPDGTAELG